MYQRLMHHNLLAFTRPGGGETSGGSLRSSIHKVMGDHASRGFTSAGASPSTWSFPVFFP